VGRASEFHVDIIAIDLSGRQTNLTQSPSLNASPAPAPDGRIAFVSDRDGTADLFVMDGDGRNVHRLTTNAGVVGGAEDLEVSHVAWSPQGDQIAFDSTWGPVEPNCPQHCTGWALSVVGSGGSSPRQIAVNARAPAWSPSSGRLAFDSSVAVVDYDDAGSVTIAHPDGSGAVQVSAPSNSSEVGPAWSPTGRELEYEALRNPDGSPWVYIVRADGRQKRPLAAGHDATWSPDGKRLAFVHDYRLITIGRDGRGRRRISPTGEYVVTAVWSPKGQTIAYVAGTTIRRYERLPANLRIETMRADGTHRHVLSREAEVLGKPVWTADGRRILAAVTP
jgi:Tol biopolymer transport system component